MTEVTFYLEDETEDSSRQHREDFVCQLLSRHAKQAYKILLLCQNQEQAERIDDACFSQKLTQFTPHYLSGENNSYGCNVEFSWIGAKITLNRGFLLINLAENTANFSQNFQQVVDFVPTNEKLKQLARVRYRDYQKLRCSIMTCKLNPIDNELAKVEKANNHGKNIQS